MRKRAILIAFGLVAAASTAGVVAAQAGTPATATASHFTVVEHALTDTVVDNAPTGDSLGDLLAFGNPIYDATNTKHIGSDTGSCIRTKVGASYECTWTVTFQYGSLAVEGPFYDTADSVLAVTGGTGRWATARGQMTLHARNAAGSAYDFVFDVRT